MNPNKGSDEFNRRQLRSLQAIDRAVGAIVDKVTALGKLDQTVFIFTSDNGYMWGEHGLWAKGMPLDARKGLATTVFRAPAGEVGSPTAFN